MKRLAIVVVLVMGVTSLAWAQRRTQPASTMGFFRTPVFVAQPGLIRSFSTGDGLDINARFVTAIPTSVNRLTIVGIVQWTPFQDEDSDGAKENAPAFVYGAVVNVANERQFSFDVDGLFAYGPGCSGSASDYCHKFLIEGDFFLKLGSMMNAKSQWNSLNLYAMLAYILTGLPAGLESKDRMVLLTGLSLPLAPWRR
jgi:hypothetical protein